MGFCVLYTPAQFFTTVSFAFQTKAGIVEKHFLFIKLWLLFVWMIFGGMTLGAPCPPMCLHRKAKVGGYTANTPKTTILGKPPWPSIHKLLIHFPVYLQRAVLFFLASGAVSGRGHWSRKARLSPSSELLSSGCSPLLPDHYCCQKQYCRWEEWFSPEGDLKKKKKKRG